MSHATRVSRSWKTVLSECSLEGRLLLVPRVTVGIMVLVLTLALGGPLITSRRLADIQQNAYPSLHDARALGAIVQAIHQHSSPAESGPERQVYNDSLVERFHALALSSRATPLVALDSRFSEYLALEHGGASPGDAARAYDALIGELASNQALAEQEIADALASAETVGTWLTCAVVAGGVVALVALALLGKAVAGSVRESIEEVTRTVEALATGERALLGVIPAPGAVGRLEAAIRRLSKQVRHNADVATALAAGELARAPRGHAPGDPVGAALAELRTRMDEMAAAARRLARGDLGASFTPTSTHDSFGHAHLAMTRRFSAALLDVESTRHAIAGIVERVRGDVASLAASTGNDAETFRRALDQMTLVTLQSRSAADRSAMLTERAADSDDMLRHAAAAFDDSLAGLTELVRASGTAQRLARHAGQLAVRAAVGSNGESALEDQARAIAEEAATTMRAMVRTVVEGSEQAHVSGVAVDRVAIALREGTALVREVGMVAREQAETLGSLDTEMMRAQGSVARSAETARSLANRLDALSSHARRLDAILGRFRSGPPPVVTTAAPLQRRSIAVLRPGVERRMPQTSRSRSES
jgi:methyl-accepting chemotaxis protein